MASALTYYFRDYETDLGLDNEDLFNSVLVDLYNAEIIGMPITRLENVDMGANQSITTTTYQPVGGSGFGHIFTKKNAKIRCENIRLVQSNAGIETSVRPDIETLTADDFTEFITSGTDPREGSCEATYSNLAVGAARIIRLLGKRPSGTGTVNRYPVLTWSVEEWD